jgi:siroheme synthase-like protein
LCVVVGAGEVAGRKVAGLINAGARVTAIAAEATEELARLARVGTIVWERRAYRAGDLAGARLAIAATDDPEVNREVAREAEAANIPFNAVDDLKLSTFITPAVVARGDLVIAVSTGGRSPSLARKVRERIDRDLSSEYAALLDIAADVRAALFAQGVRPSAERWSEALSDEALELARVGDTVGARARLVKTLVAEPTAAGKVSR